MKLYDILKEIQGKPKAIILAGAPGAGKGYILRGLDLGGLKILNVDDIYVPMLKKANITLDLKNATPEERCKQAIAMGAANKEFKQDVANTIEGKQSFILDGTGASFKQTSKLKAELEQAGYEVFMLYVYTDLERSLKQNQDRYEKSDGKDRSLAPGIVMKTWKDVTQNFKPYKDLFGSNFTSVANTLKDQEISDLKDITDTYLVPFTPKGTKPKTPEQQAKSDARKAKDAEEIKTMLNDEFIKDIVNNSVSAEEAQSKLKSFLA